MIYNLYVSSYSEKISIKICEEIEGRKCVLNEYVDPPICQCFIMEGISAADYVIVKAWV